MTSSTSTKPGPASPPDPDRALLRVENLSVVLGGKMVVDSVSFSLERGVVLGVIGANGSGKTTLLRVIAGLLDAEPGGGIGFAGAGRSGGIAASNSGRPIDTENEGLEFGVLSHGERSRMLAYMPQHAESHPVSVFEAVLMG
ncbi:MAG: ABC transporter ATP-binding protein, partial [Chloroflexi bacterium]|nr:ABC transporter ATP-binding protein [Chloroflexota bacterium]